MAAGITTLETGYNFLSPSVGPYIRVSWDDGIVEGTHNLIGLVHVSTAPGADFSSNFVARTDFDTYAENQLIWGGLAYDTTYYVRVKIVNALLEVIYPDAVELSVATPEAEPVASVPVFAGIVSVVALDENTVRVTWAEGSSVVTLHENLVYEIHFSTVESDDFTLRGESTPGATQCDIRNLEQGVTYYFRVRCRDEYGNRSVE